VKIKKTILCLELITGRHVRNKSFYRHGSPKTKLIFVSDKKYLLSNIIVCMIFRKWEGVVGTGWSWLIIGRGGGYL
jgi:hypothetical protein